MWWHALDCILYLNLAHRPERASRLLATLDSLGLPRHLVRRVGATSLPSRGYRGCTLSHRRAVRYALRRQCRYVWILEDDFELTVSPEDFHAAAQRAWSQLTNDAGRLTARFDVWYLHCTPLSLEPVAPPLHRVVRALAMPAYVVSGAYLPVLEQIYTRALRENRPHDLVTQEYQPWQRWYTLFPPLSRQSPGYSDIEQQEVDYTRLEQGVKLG